MSDKNAQAVLQSIGAASSELADLPIWGSNTRIGHKAISEVATLIDATEIRYVSAEVHDPESTAFSIRVFTDRFLIAVRNENPESWPSSTITPRHMLSGMRMISAPVVSGDFFEPVAPGSLTVELSYPTDTFRLTTEGESWARRREQLNAFLPSLLEDLESSTVAERSSEAAR